MQVIIIPLWLSRKLDAAKLPLTVVLDTERLSTILSKEDLFFLQKANDCHAEDNAPLALQNIRTDFPICDARSLTNLSESEYWILTGQYQPTHSSERRAIVYGDVHGLEKTSNVVLNYETAMIAPEVCAVKVTHDSEVKDTQSLEEFLDVMQGQIGAEKVYGLKSFDTFIKKV